MVSVPTMGEHPGGRPADVQDTWDVIVVGGGPPGENAAQYATSASARHAVVLATGSTASIPAIPGLRESLPWTSRDVTNLHEVPDRVAIVGGGVVACEAAVWLQALGAQVTLLVAGEALLTRHEPFAGDLVAARLAESGVDVRTGIGVDRVHRSETVAPRTGHRHGGPVTLTVTVDGVTVDGGPLVVDEVVVATGRTPSTADLGLDTVGLTRDALRGPGYLRTDEHLAVQGVEGDWLYAVGDVTGRALLTHQGKYQGRIVGAVISARAEGRPLDAGPGPGPYADVADSPDGGTGPAVPQVVFTDPQVAAVGFVERDAWAAGIDVGTVEFDLGDVAGAALLRDGYTGRAKLVFDRSADVLVGATFVGPDVAELLHAATIAVVGRVPLATLWHAVPAYPTVSEVWLRLLEVRRGGG
jgi:pyruvate/2-oxoglutarate dehydrogenase complex dihydrolipoamide dehydrogenase (E3) component